VVSESDGLPLERVAAMLHVSLARLKEAIESGALRAERRGEEVVVRRRQLAKFVRNGNPFEPAIERPTDEELMAHAQAGDAAAFDELAERHRSALWKQCYAIVGNAEDAHDLAQKTLTAAYMRRMTFRRGARVAPWLWAIAKNNCRTFLRSARAEARWRVENAGSIGVDERPDVGQGLAQDAEQQELVEAMRRCLAALPSDRHRAAIRLRFYEGMTYREMMPHLSVTTPRGAQYVVDEAVERLRDYCRRCEEIELI